MARRAEVLLLERTVHSRPKMQTQLIQFLQSELAIPNCSIEFALKHCEALSTQLPMGLWQYGMINLEQLDQILDWLEIFS